MSVPHVSASELERALPMADAVAAMRRAFEQLARDEAVVPARIALPVDDRGTVLVKPCHVPGVGLGTKIVSVFPENRRRHRPTTTGLMIMQSELTGEPMATLDGGALTAWRTGATGGLAADRFARRGASTALVIGAGVQCRAQVLGLLAVRPIERVFVAARDRDRLRSVVDALAAETGVDVRPVVDVAAVSANVDIVSTVTTSSTPVLRDSWVGPGTHVNAMGSFRPDQRELDDGLVDRATIVVDSRDAAAREAGELVGAVRRGTDPADWLELGSCLLEPDVVSGGPTVFKSVGLAVQDVAAAAAALVSLGLSAETD